MKRRKKKHFLPQAQNYFGTLLWLFLWIKKIQNKSAINQWWRSQHKKKDRKEERHEEYCFVIYLQFHACKVSKNKLVRIIIHSFPWAHLHFCSSFCFMNANALFFNLSVCRQDIYMISKIIRRLNRNRKIEWMEWGDVLFSNGKLCGIMKDLMFCEELRDGVCKVIENGIMSSVSIWCNWLEMLMNF